MNWEDELEEKTIYNMLPYEIEEGVLKKQDVYNLCKRVIIENNIEIGIKMCSSNFCIDDIRNYNLKLIKEIKGE